MERQEISDRLREFIESQQLTIKDFEQIIDVSPSTINRFVNKKTVPQIAILEKIAAVYPALNMDWLINGRGSMEYNSDAEDYSEKLKQTTQELLETKNALIERLSYENTRHDEFLDHILYLVSHIRK